MAVVGPVGSVAYLSLRASLRGIRTAALALFAAVPSLVLVALDAAHASHASLERVSQALFLDLTLPIVAIVILLILAVAQFRNEIDDDTLGYLSSRSIPRWGIVVGKYLGCVGASLVFLVPAGLGPLAVAGLAGAPAPTAAVLTAVVAMTVLGTVAYAAVFLVLGLLTGWALLYGLLIGFLWEELLRHLPGSVPHLTVSFYLYSLGSDLVAAGPLSGYSICVATPVAIAGPIGAAIVFLAVGMTTIRFVELVPQRTSA
jgi:ABC-2 type transport system permease protein